MGPRHTYLFEGKKLTLTQARRTALRLRREDWTIKHVADALEASVATVNRWYALAGVTRKTPGCGGGAQFDHDEAIALYATGDYTFEALGAKFGVHASSISNIVRVKAPHLTISGSREEVDEAKLVGMYAGDPDATLTDVAKEFGVHMQTAKRIIQRNAPGLAIRGRGPKRKVNHVEAIALYGTGLYSFPEIAAKWGVDQSTIHRIIARHAPHLLKKRPGRRRKFDWEQCAKLYETGRFSRPELAEMFGVTIGPIDRALKALGVRQPERKSKARREALLYAA
jgi:transposase